MAVAVCYETPTRFARYTVADGTGIPKGTLLQLATPETATAATSDNDIVGGIAWMEKVAHDGSTEIVAALDGVWGITTTAAAVTIGSFVGIGGTNEIKVFTAGDNELGYCIGRALETCAAAVVLKVRVWCV